MLQTMILVSQTSLYLHIGPKGLSQVCQKTLV